MTNFLKCLTHNLNIFGKGIKVHERLECKIVYDGPKPDEIEDRPRGAKLTWKDIEKIRNNYKFRSNLHKDYRVSPSTISNIVRKKTWKFPIPE